MLLYLPSHLTFRTFQWSIQGSIIPIYNWGNRDPVSLWADFQPLSQLQTNPSYTLLMMLGLGGLRKHPSFDSCYAPTIADTRRTGQGWTEEGEGICSLVRLLSLNSSPVPRSSCSFQFLFISIHLDPVSSCPLGNTSTSWLPPPSLRFKNQLCRGLTHRQASKF